MKVLVAFYKSLYDFSWLKAQRKNGELAWSYFLLFVFVLAAFTFIPAIILFPGNLKELKQEGFKKIPEFTATFSQGKLAISGLQQPLVYKDETEDFVLVVDTVTTTALDLANFLPDKDQSGILITADKVEIFDADQQKSEVQYWTDIPDTSFDKARLQSWADTLLSTPVMFLIGLVIVIVLFMGMGIGKLFTLLLVIFIVWIVSELTKRQWKFGELFTVGLFGVRLPSFLAIVAKYFSVRIPGIFFLALLAFMLAVVLTKENEPQEAMN